jgi:hypothetical protein
VVVVEHPDRYPEEAADARHDGNPFISRPRHPAPMLQPADLAPEFELPDQNGDPVKLSDLKGQRRRAAICSALVPSSSAAISQ